MKRLFIEPQPIKPADFLSPQEVQKIAGIRLSQPPGYWDDEITQILLREHPYIPGDRVVVNFRKKDDAQASAVGYVGVIGAPTVSIPVVIKNHELAPLDILIVRADPSGQTEQGSGDMTDDEIMPLTEETFSQALDTGEIGTPVHENEVLGTGWTEDGSSLRLPFRGRTVVAGLIGVSKGQQDKLAAVLKDQDILAGYFHNRTTDVLEQWLQAQPCQNIFLQKVASVPVDRGVALILDRVPEELACADFGSALIFVGNDQAKVAATFDAVDFASPHRGQSRYLVFEDGTYCRAPEKVASMKTEESEEQMTARIFEKCSTASLKRGSIVSFAVDEHVTVPAKIASITTDPQGVTLSMLDDMGREYPVVLSSALKVAMFDDASRTWMLPLNARVLEFTGYADAKPMELAKVAQVMAAQLPDQIVCSGGQFSLSIRGQAFGGAPMSEAKMAELLGAWLENGEFLLEMVKQSAAEAVTGTGSVRFQSNLPERVLEVTKLASAFDRYPSMARELVNQVGMPLEKAVKLAASIGDPDGVDAILSAGFLTEDNVAEFLSLSDFFEDTIEKLARLLLAVRLGFPGDESATMVAMKSLQRVSEGLRSATQEMAA